MDIKTAEFDAGFESVDNVAKKLFKNIFLCKSFYIFF
jgi:hypothetical protein